jgi:flagellar assembly protein FliH
MSIDRKRGFLRPQTAEEIEKTEAWGVPDYSEERQAKPTAFNYDPGWIPDFSEESEEQDIPPLTQQDLESIRQDAYQEGLMQGKEAGFTQGYEKGKAEGLLAGQAEGLELGKNEGIEQGQETIKQHIESFVELANQFAQPLELMNAQVERQLVDMVLTLVKEVVHVEVQTNSQIILDTVKESVESLPITGHSISLKLNPEDAKLVREAYGESELEQRKWTLIHEPALQRGDVQIEAGESSVSYRIDERIHSVITRFCSANRHYGGE